MQSSIIDALACPHDGRGLVLEGRVLGCPMGHRFDRAKQGYATLIRRPLAHGGDPAALIERRLRVHDAGLLDLLHRTLTAAAAAPTAAGWDTGPDGDRAGSPAPAPLPGIICDVGAGPGTYLAAVLDALPGRSGLAIDVSRAAARRAARCHDRAAAVVADVWEGLPIRTGAVSLLLNVFAPRNVDEFARVLAPGGQLLVMTPAPRHLLELRDHFGLLAVGTGKEDGLRTRLGRGFEAAGSDRVATTITVSPMQAAELAGMGASGHHLDEELLQLRASTLPERVSVTIAATLSRFVRTDRPGMARERPG